MHVSCFFGVEQERVFLLLWGIAAAALYQLSIVFWTDNNLLPTAKIKKTFGFYTGNSDTCPSNQTITTVQIIKRLRPKQQAAKVMQLSKPAVYTGQAA